MYLASLDIFLITLIFASYCSIILFVKSRTNSIMLSFVTSLLIIVLFGSIVTNQVLLNEILMVLILFLLIVLCLLFYMEKRLIIVDKQKMSKMERFLRSIFFLFFASLAFISISEISYDIVQKVKFKKESQVQKIISQDEKLYHSPKAYSDPFDFLKNNKNIINKSNKTQRIEKLKESPFFIRLENMIFIYLGISIFLFIFLRKRGENCDDSGV